MLNNPGAILALLGVMPILGAGLILFFFIREKRRGPLVYVRSKSTERARGTRYKTVVLREYQQTKTIWDLAQLVIIPIMLVILTTVFSLERNLNSQNLSLDQEQQTTLEAYINQMSDLLLSTSIHPNLHDSVKGDEIRKVARSLTLLALSRLDAKRKGFLILFLYQADLITWQHYNGTPGTDFPIVLINGADLIGAKR